MSKNFELMQEVAGGALPQSAYDRQSTPLVVLESENDRSGVRSSSDFDALAQQECLKLVQRIFLGQPDRYHIVVFAGVDRGNGCSRICVEAARILAGSTSDLVCLVDANFRNPSLPKFFGTTNHRGLVTSLLEEGEISGFRKQLAPPNLWLLSAGTIDFQSPNLLTSHRLKGRLQELRNECAYVLIDSPPLNLYGDAVALGGIAEGLIVVLQADSTRRESALKGLQTLRDARINVLGAVLNRRTFPIPNFVYQRL
jgi:polysaccharide biosynthesis transport protein